jgi:Large ribosomal RNA subunit accumulation protein YceD
MTPEFSHPVSIELIGDGGHDIALAADADARRRLAGRFGWIGIEALSARMTLTQRAGSIDATGHLNAVVEQKCVATGDPVRETVDTDFALRFVDTALLGTQQVVELSDDDLDVIDYTGNSIDAGEAVAQTLALSVDPYPRCPDADAKLRAAGVIGEGESGAFAGLKGLLGSKS